MWIDDVASILQSASVGTFGTDLFAGRAPESPDNLVALIPYGGRQSERTHSGTDRRFPRFQVLARNKKADLALAKAEAVRAALVAVKQKTVGSVNYEVIIPLGEPLALAHDAVGRFPYVVSYEVRWHAS